VIHYFYGEDTFEARRAIDELASEEGAKLRWLDREDLESKSLVEWLGQGVGLFGKELPVVRDGNRLPTHLQEQIWQSVEQSVASGVVWDRGKVDKRSAWYKKLRGEGKEFTQPSFGEVKEWLVLEGEQRGGEVEESAAQMLVGRLGVDRWRLTSELERLLLTAKVVTKEMVEESVPEKASAEIFMMLDALTEGDKKLAMQQVEDLLEGGESEFYVLSMLAYQFRTLLAIRLAIDHGVAQREIAREGGLKPFTVNKNYGQARNFSAAYLREALTRILATDFAIRQGSVDQRTALLMLVLSLVK